jgi:hypothetical protein
MGGKGGQHQQCTQTIEEEDSASRTSSHLDGPSMILLTGPNYSGKSVYQKQIAVAVYMAHMGSFVPADAAIIGMTDKILTRIMTRETVSKTQSAFMIDVQQIALALNQATRRSLVIIDEFGKGTDSCGSSNPTLSPDQFNDLFIVEHSLNGKVQTDTSQMAPDWLQASSSIFSRWVHPLQKSSLQLTSTKSSNKASCSPSATSLLHTWKCSLMRRARAVRGTLPPRSRIFMRKHSYTFLIVLSIILTHPQLY